MKLREIISISGKPGLYRLANTARMPFTAEELGAGRKIPVFARDRVTTLGDISMYSKEGDTPLGEVLQAIRDKYSTTQPNVAEITKSSETLHQFMNEVFPTYNKERVRDSDIKKLIKWYVILIDAGMEQFIEPEQSEEPTTKEQKE